MMKIFAIDTIVLEHDHYNPPKVSRRCFVQLREGFGHPIINKTWEELTERQFLGFQRIQIALQRGRDTA